MKPRLCFSKFVYLNVVIIVFFFSNVQAQTWQTVFFDNFNRTDSLMGTNYNTGAANVTQSGVFNNEVKVSSGSTTPAYWNVSYINDINYDSIRVSCKFRANNNNFGFSLSARDNGITTYSAGLMAMTDTIGIYLRDYTGNSKKLAGTKAYFSASKTYFLQFTLKHADLSFRFVEAGQTDTIFLYAINDSLHGKKVNLSSYYYAPFTSNYFDDFRIEAYTKNVIGIGNLQSIKPMIYPNPARDEITLITNNTAAANQELYIYSVLGKLIRTVKLQKIQAVIDISDLDNGLYLLEINSDNQSFIQKLIIQR